MDQEHLYAAIEQLEDLCHDLEANIADRRQDLEMYSQLGDAKTAETIEAELSGLTQSLEKNEEKLNELYDQLPG